MLLLYLQERLSALTSVSRIVWRRVRTLLRPMLLGTAAADRPSLAPGSPGFFTGPPVGCLKSMCRFPAFARNLTLLFGAHSSETATFL
jgi:hypothetical protein